MVNLRKWRLCLSWLLRNDPEAREYWRSLPEGADLEGAVRDNLQQFGPDISGQAEWILEVA